MRCLYYIPLILATGFFGATSAQNEDQNVSGSCAGGAEFTVFSRRESFKNADQFCMEQGGRLARISNANEHFQVEELIKSSNLGNNFWIG